MLFKSVFAFAHQTYPNKELVVSYPSNDEYTQRLLFYFIENKSINIIPLERTENCSVGTARNQAVEVAKGDYICIWDDDDIHEEKRLSTQFNALEPDGKIFEASVIVQILLYQVFN